MTTAASVACGISAITGASRSMVARAAAAVTSSAICGHGSEESATHVGKSCSQQLPIRAGSWLIALGKCAASSDGFSKAHESNTQGSGPETLGKRKVRQGEGGQSLWNPADQLHPMRLQPKQCGACNPGGDRNQRGRCARHKMLHSHKQDDHDDSDGDGRQRGVGNSLDCGQQIMEERAPGNVYPQNLRELIEYDDQTDARLEADQNRLGDKVGHESQPQH